MKFIHLADLHIGKRVNGFSMIEDQRYILSQIIDIIEEHKCEGVFIAGDIYDKAIPPAEAVSLFDDFLTELTNRDVPVMIITGNHDSAERVSFGASLMTGSGVYITGIFTGDVQCVTMKDCYGKLAIHMLPFIRPVDVRRAYGDDDIHTYNEAVSSVINHMNINTDTRNIILCHQNVTGAITCDSEEIIIGGLDQVDRSLFDIFDYVALGHLHRPQSVGREEVRYSGTPIKYSFSEINNDKSVTIVDMRDKGNVALEQVPLKPLHDMRQIRGPFEKLISPEVYNSASVNDYMHVVLTDEEEILNGMDRLRNIYPNIMKLEYDNTRTSKLQAVNAERNVKHKSPMELFETFYEKQNNSKMSDEQHNIVEGIIAGIWRDTK